MIQRLKNLEKRVTDLYQKLKGVSSSEGTPYTPIVLQSFVTMAQGGVGADGVLQELKSELPFTLPTVASRQAVGSYLFSMPANIVYVIGVDSVSPDTHDVYIKQISATFVAIKVVNKLTQAVTDANTTVNFTIKLL